MTSSRWSEPLTQTEPKGGTQMELSACIVVYNGAGEAIRPRRPCWTAPAATRSPYIWWITPARTQRPAADRRCQGRHLRTVPGQTVQVLCRLENGGFGTGHNTVLSLLHSRVHFILNPDIQLTADT